jgi:hypothetical protein
VSGGIIKSATSAASLPHPRFAVGVRVGVREGGGKAVGLAVVAVGVSETVAEGDGVKGVAVRVSGGLLLRVRIKSKPIAPQQNSRSMITIPAIMAISQYLFIDPTIIARSMWVGSFSVKTAYSP